MCVKLPVTPPPFFCPLLGSSMVLTQLYQAPKLEPLPWYKACGVREVPLSEEKEDSAHIPSQRWGSCLFLQLPSPLLSADTRLWSEWRLAGGRPLHSPIAPNPGGSSEAGPGTSTAGPGQLSLIPILGLRVTPSPCRRTERDPKQLKSLGHQ